MVNSFKISNSFTAEELSFKHVFNAIKGVMKWYELGVQLDLEKSRLDIIKANHPNDVVEAKLELVSEWLNNDPDKSWDKLASALRQIGHINLSDKICAYGRGMLFSIVLSCSNVCTRKYFVIVSYCMLCFIDYITSTLHICPDFTPYISYTTHVYQNA